MFMFMMAAAPAIELPCRYAIYAGWESIKGLYFCELSRSLDIPTPITEITSVTGTHNDQKSNMNVAGFYADNKTMQFLPQGLEKYFVAEKIEFIEIRMTRLMQIRQSDLKPFIKMKIFSAWNNNLRVIERDLFKFNPEIEFVGLGRNQIKFIDGKVFQNLNKLGTVYLDGNVCTGEFVNSEEMDDYKERLLNLTMLIKRKCSPYR